MRSVRPKNAMRSTSNAAAMKRGTRPFNSRALYPTGRSWSPNTYLRSKPPPAAVRNSSNGGGFQLRQGRRLPGRPAQVVTSADRRKDLVGSDSLHADVVPAG